MIKTKLKARKIIKELELDHPVDIDVLLKKLDIVLLEGNFESPSAMLWRDSEDDIILIDKNQSIGEYRFNCLHEIGHIVLGHEEVIMQVSDKKTYKEKAADIFASEVLIPKTKVKKAAHKFNFDIQKLKEYFIVSEKAMVVKMKVLDLPYKNTRY